MQYGIYTICPTTHPYNCALCSGHPCICPAAVWTPLYQFNHAMYTLAFVQPNCGHRYICLTMLWTPLHLSNHTWTPIHLYSQNIVTLWTPLYLFNNATDTLTSVQPTMDTLISVQPHYEHPYICSTMLWTPFRAGLRDHGTLGKVNWVGPQRKW